MRPIEKDGKWEQKSKSVNGKKVPTVDWNEQTKAEEWRRGWIGEDEGRAAGNRCP